MARTVAGAIGGERVGVRLSPYGVNAGMTAYPEVDETYRALVSRLAPTGIQYLHLCDHSAMGAPAVPEALKLELRRAGPGPSPWPEDHAELARLVESGAVRPVVARVFPLERGAEAFAALEAGGTVGKVIIRVA